MRVRLPGFDERLGTVAAAIDEAHVDTDRLAVRVVRDQGRQFQRSPGVWVTNTPG